MKTIKTAGAAILADSSPEEYSNIVNISKDSENLSFNCNKLPTNNIIPFAGYDSSIAPEYKYFNFPVVFLKDGVRNIKTMCVNIINYCTYAKSLKYNGDIHERIKQTELYYIIEVGSRNFRDGKVLYESIPTGLPMVGIKTTMIFDFLVNEKSDFEIDVFLAFVASRSILGQKKYCKTNNNFLLCRMAGEPKVNLLPIRLLRYKGRYQMDKLKNEIKCNWGMDFYGYHVKGFYISSPNKITYKELVLEVMSKQKTTKEKLFKEKQKQAIEEANRILYPSKE